jgi:hypothetical protein
VTHNFFTSHLKPIAISGLVAKGTVYCLLGALTFMAAFRIGGHSAKETSKEGVFEFVHRQTGGQVMLGVIALGLFCYVLWRFIQAFADTADKGNDAKGIAVRARYVLSGLIYGSLAVHVVQRIVSGAKGSGSQKEDITAQALQMPAGEWLVGLGALILVGVGCYQLYYGYSGKYKKYVEKAAGHNRQGLLLGAGKVGYVARGLVWLLLAWLFFKAALHANSNEAGDTSKAFAFLHDAEYGKFLLAAIGFGLVCYGVFNFIRARFERFGR